MASLFKQRKPKRIVSSASDDPVDAEDTGPVVRRPGALKPKSKLRVAFDPDQDQDSSNLPSENDVRVVKPNKPRPSTALQDKLRETSLREQEGEARPSYSKSYLDELRNSTPSTPLSLTTTTPPSEQQLDISSKFPSAAAFTNTAHIPSTTEIAAFKARRARAAHESAAEDFIPLDDAQLYDSDGEFKPQRLQVGAYLPASEKEKDTRLVHEDEDIMEGFESYVEDINPGGRIQMDMSKRAERQRLKAERESIRTQIATAEDTDSEGSEYDSDDAELHAQYEASQFHAGLDGLGSAHAEHTRQSKRPKPPKVVTPIEKLSVGLGRLREQVARIELEKGKIERRKGEIARERKELNDQREHVQKSLEEASEELEKVQRVTGRLSGDEKDPAGDRGLESLGMMVDGDGDDASSR